MPIIELHNFGIRAADLQPRAEWANATEILRPGGQRALDPVVAVAIIAGGVKLLSDIIQPILLHVLALRQERLSHKLKPARPATVIIQLVDRTINETYKLRIASDGSFQHDKLPEVSIDHDGNSSPQVQLRIVE